MTTKDIYHSVRMQDQFFLRQKVQRYIKTLFENDLDVKYVYHNYKHTWETVQAAIEIGKGSGLSDYDLLIVEIAAWFHDVGYIESWYNHEILSAQMAESYLSKSNWCTNNVQKIVDCILATQVPQSPTNLLEQVLCDADLINLGLEKHWEQSNRLREEWAITRNLVYTDKAWELYSIDFLKELYISRDSRLRSTMVC